jgi:hypothetical protein
MAAIPQRMAAIPQRMAATPDGAARRHGSGDCGCRAAARRPRPLGELAAAVASSAAARAIKMICQPGMPPPCRPVWAGTRARGIMPDPDPGGIATARAHGVAARDTSRAVGTASTARADLASTARARLASAARR